MGLTVTLPGYDLTRLDELTPDPVYAGNSGPDPFANAYPV
jgi:hypothetical protein